MELVDAFRWQAQACSDSGSPLYGALLTRLAEDLVDGGAETMSVLRGHEDDAGPSALALRLLGAVHRQVLQGDAPALATYYPSVGGVWHLDTAWPAFLATLTERHDEVSRLLASAPQTNEVGRASALLGGLLHLGAAHRLPIRLFEIGSSGGLNLRADHFCYLRADGTGWGPVDSPVLLDPAWQGSALPDAPVDIVERAGSDIAPIDVATQDGRLALLSYVWPDQLARFSRLRGAFELADIVPVDVQRADAVRFLHQVSLQPDATTVVWHSVMWQYLSADEQRAAESRIEELALTADSTQPFAHLTLEPGCRTPGVDRELLVALQMWPAGERRILGSSVAHGVPTTWD